MVGVVCVSDRLGVGDELGSNELDCFANCEVVEKFDQWSWSELCAT